MIVVSFFGSMRHPFVDLSPSFGVVFAQALSKVSVIVVVVLGIGTEMHALGKLLQMRDIVRGVATPQYRRGSLVLLLALPQQVATQGRCQFVFEH